MLQEGFKELVVLAMKEKPVKPRGTKEIWDKFLRIVFMGGKRGEPDINLILTILKQQVEMDYLLKTDGDDWRESVNKLIDERVQKIKDDDTLVILRGLQKELFRISASIKGGARFFQENKVSPEFLERALQTKESTRAFIEDLVNDEDVSNIRYTKAIVWLHSMGYANEFCPPSYQIKNFVNEIYGYYQFYEDDKYFMQKAEQFSEEVKKTVGKASVRDVAVAIFYYVTFKNMIPPRSPEKRKFNAAVLVKFLKAKKLSLKSVSGKLGDYDSREQLGESFYRFIHETR